MSPGCGDVIPSVDAMDRESVLEVHEDVAVVVVVVLVVVVLETVVDDGGPCLW